MVYGYKGNIYIYTSTSIIISITLKIIAKEKLAHWVRSPVTLSSPPLLGYAVLAGVFFRLRWNPYVGMRRFRKKVKEICK